MIFYRDQISHIPAAPNLIPKLTEPPCSLQDCPAGSVIHRKCQLLCPETVFQKEEHIFPGAPPAVDYLIGISHSKEPRTAVWYAVFCKSSQEIHLHSVTVLHLVHNDPLRMKEFFLRLLFPQLFFPRFFFSCPTHPSVFTASAPLIPCIRSVPASSSSVLTRSRSEKDILFCLFFSSSRIG